MKKEVELIKKVNLLLKRINAPEYLHKFGPKTYKLSEVVYTLFLRTEWKCSFRRTVKLCTQIGIKCPSKSTLHYTLKRIPWNFIKNMLNVSIRRSVNLAAMDGTTLSQSNPSWHYINRTGIDMRQRKPVKLSVLVDTKTKKILSARFRKKIVHDIKDAKYLIKNSSQKPNTLVADKSYDAEWFHKFLHERGIKVCIPVRKGINHGFYRKRSKCHKKTYGRREMSESCFSKLKKLFGNSLNSVSAHMQRAEIFFRMICYNLEVLRMS